MTNPDASQRSAEWAEPRGQKLFRVIRKGDVFPTWAVRKPSAKANRETPHRRRMIRIEFEDGSVHHFACRLTIAPKDSGGRVTARVSLGRRRVETYSSSVRLAWRPILAAVRDLLEKEPDIDRLTKAKPSSWSWE